MKRGDWAAAWAETDRLELPRRDAQRAPGFRREPHHLVWDGTPFDGRSVLVRCLHGLGDTLQFMRFVPQLATHSRELHFLVQPMLLDLLQGLPGLGEVSNAWTDHPPPHEVEIEVMELAYAVRATADDVPPPYPHLLERAAHRPTPPLPGGDGLRVALFWSVSDWETSRSVPLELLEPFTRIPGVRCFSLQQGRAANDERLRRWGVHVLSPHTTGIADAAAVLARMDLVVCVDGMPAHLAAHLGRPTWILLKDDPDWRWQSAGATSPWYPTVRLFRQPEPGDWAGAVAQAVRALEQRVLKPVAG